MLNESDLSPIEYENLQTEKINPASSNLDTLSTLEIVNMIANEDYNAVKAVAKCSNEIAMAVDYIADAFNNNGRLFYIGAGTSGRLGVLDASECPPTFGVDPEMVQGIIAGGYDALVKSKEGAEDYPEDGSKDLLKKGFSSKDVLVGIAASSVTPYVLGALKTAKEMESKTIFVTCNKTELDIIVDVIIAPIVGPEIITGSTRMKAGTATKLVLNALTTTAMVKIGKTFGNLMVDLKPSCRKLIDRSIRIVMTIASTSRDEAVNLLKQSNHNVKVAILLAKGAQDINHAQELLKQSGGFLRKAMEII